MLKVARDDCGEDIFSGRDVAHELVLLDFRYLQGSPILGFRKADYTLEYALVAPAPRVLERHPILAAPLKNPVTIALLFGCHVSSVSSLRGLLPLCGLFRYVALW